MAEEIVLVGQFRDEITPKLKKLNKELTKVTKNFNKLGAKLKPITADMRKLADESERVADALKMQKNAIDVNTRSWNAYKVAVGKAGSAQRRAFKGTTRGGKGPGSVPRSGGSGGAGGGFAAAAGGAVLGGTISTVLTNAVVAGFRIGAQFITKPFTLFGSALNERIQDEMSDVRAAGGLFAISRRMQGGGFVSNFAEAEALTKEQNRYLAQLAGALPGDTQEYINVAKQISDGVYTVISQDRDNAIKLGQELAQARGADTSRFAEGGAAAMQAAGKEMVGELTKLTVLAGLGGQQGAFGLPQLTEQIISRDEVTLGQFKRYAAIFRDPMIKGALERNIEQINATAKNTTDRFNAVREMLQEVVTPELVRRYQRTTSGVLEALKTTFLNPEVGLLGLGRPLNIMAKTFDEFGNQITKNGKAVTEALSVFDYLRDIFANVMIVLQPVIEAATSLFDPFTDLGNQLNRLRNATMFFQNSFERYRKGLESIAKGLVGEEKATFESTLTLRAALAAINNAFVDLGVYGKEEFDKIAEILTNPKKGMAEFQKVISDMVTKFLNSEGAKKIGEAIGGIIGTVVATVGKVLAQIAGIAKAGPLAEGFNAGFEAAGGKEGIKNIIKSVFELIGKGILAVFEAAPFETSLIAGLTLFGPAIASALGTALLSGIGKAGAGLFAAKGAAGAAGAGAAGKGGMAALMAGFGKLAAAIPPILAVLAVLLLLGGGLEGTMRQLTDFFGEVFSSLGGSFQALFDIFGVFFGLINDLFTGIGSLVPGLFGFEQGLDMIKLVLAPITLAFQAFELGLRGLASMLAWVRMKLTDMFGSEEDKRKRREEFQSLEDKRAASQGRINAYNASIRGPEVMRQQLAAAVKEYQTDKNLKQTRSVELKTFIDETRRLLASNTPKAVTPGKPAVPGSALTAANPQVATQISENLGKLSTDTSQKLTGLTTQVAGSSNNIQAKIGATNARLNSTLSVRVTNVSEFTKNSGGGKFAGGSVMSSRSYMVGEKGPELFTPNSSGKITSNGDLSTGGGVTIGAINISGVNDPQAIANQVADEILIAIRKASYSELEMT